MPNILCAIVCMLAVQSCCSCNDHGPRSKVVAATEVAQLAAIDFGMTLEECRMEFLDPLEYWEERRQTSELLGNGVLFEADRWLFDLQDRLAAKDHYLVSFNLADLNWSGGGLLVFVGKDPIEVLALIGQP